MAQELIQSVAALREKLKTLAGIPYLAVDTEFIRESTFFPKIALVQIATEKEVFLIDPLAFNKEELQPLRELLADKKTVKIMHASYADQECFYWSYGLIAEPVLDTSIAAGLLGLGDNIGLSKLLKEVLDLHIPKGRSRVKWLERPLPKELLEYAELDVRYLVRLGKDLLDRLRRKSREAWAFGLSEVSQEAFNESPEKIAERLGKNAHWSDRKGYPVLVELVKWREARARSLNLPRHWLCDNDVLLSLAKVKPRSIGELRSFRGLSSKEIDRSGESILTLIKKAMEAPEVPWVEADRKRGRGSPHGNHVADLIQTYVYYLASELEIVPRHLMTGEQAERLVENYSSSIEDWVAKKILSPQAAELIGKDLKSVLEGKHGFVIKNQRLTLFPLPD